MQRQVEADRAFGPDTRRCASYWDEGAMTMEYGREYRLVAVRSECGRQGDRAPLLGWFAVLPATRALYWWNTAGPALVPYGRWLKQGRTGDGTTATPDR